MSWRELMGDANTPKHGQNGQNPSLRGSENNIGHIGRGFRNSNSGLETDPKGPQPEPVEPDVVEITLRRESASIRDVVSEIDVAWPELPECPTCQQRRYWLTRQGRVVCSVCGEARFTITHLEFHPLS